MQFYSTQAGAVLPFIIAIPLVLCTGSVAVIATVPNGMGLSTDPLGNHTNMLLSIARCTHPRICF